LIVLSRKSSKIPATRVLVKQASWAALTASMKLPEGGKGIFNSLCYNPAFNAAFPGWCRPKCGDLN
jgi:hypothetical protein